MLTGMVCHGGPFRKSGEMEKFGIKVVFKLNRLRVWLAAVSLLRCDRQEVPCTSWLGLLEYIIQFRHPISELRNLNGR